MFDVWRFDARHPPIGGERIIAELPFRFRLERFWGAHRWARLWWGDTILDPTIGRWLLSIGPLGLYRTPKIR